MIDKPDPKIKIKTDSSDMPSPAKKNRSMVGWIIKIVFFPFWLVLSPLLFIYKKIFGLDKPLPLPTADNYDEYVPEEDEGWSGQIIFLIVSVFVIITLFWISRAEINAQVRAEGNIVPPTDVQVIQARLSGVVTEINVSLGSKVTNGDVLFKMQDKEVTASFNDNELTILTARASVVRLQAESDGQKDINFPERLKAKIPNVVAQEKSLFIQRIRQLDSELEVLSQEMEGLINSIQEKKAEVKIAKEQVDILQQEYDIIEPLVAAEHEPKIRLIELQGRIQNARGKQELAELAIRSLKSDRIEIEKQKSLRENSFRAEASE